MKEVPIEIGDMIELICGIPQDAAVVRAKNLRTGAEGLVLWEAVFAVARRKVCDCSAVARRCACVYVDFAASVVSELAFAFFFYLWIRSNLELIQGRFCFADFRGALLRRIIGIRQRFDNTLEKASWFAGRNINGEWCAF